MRPRSWTSRLSSDVLIDETLGPAALGVVEALTARTTRQQLYIVPLESAAGRTRSAVEVPP